MYSSKALRTAESLWGPEWEREFTSAPTTTATDVFQFCRDALPQKVLEESVPLTEEGLALLARKGHWMAVAEGARKMALQYTASQEKLYPSRHCRPRPRDDTPAGAAWHGPPPQQEEGLVLPFTLTSGLSSSSRSPLPLEGAERRSASSPSSSGSSPADLSILDRVPWPCLPPGCRTEKTIGGGGGQVRRTPTEVQALATFFTYVYRHPELLLVVDPTVYPHSPSSVSPHTTTATAASGSGPHHNTSVSSELPLYLRESLVRLPLVLAQVQALWKLRKFAQCHDVLHDLGSLERGDGEEEDVMEREKRASPESQGPMTSLDRRDVGAGSTVPQGLFPSRLGGGVPSEAGDINGVEAFVGSEEASLTALPGPTFAEISIRFDRDVTVRRNVRYLHPLTGFNLVPFSMRFLLALLPLYWKPASTSTSRGGAQSGGGSAEQAELQLSELLHAMEREQELELAHVVWLSAHLWVQYDGHRPPNGISPATAGGTTFTSALPTPGPHDGVRATLQDPISGVWTWEDLAIARATLTEQVWQPRRRRVLDALLYLRYSLRRVTAAYQTFPLLLELEEEEATAATSSQRRLLKRTEVQHHNDHPAVTGVAGSTTRCSEVGFEDQQRFAADDASCNPVSHRPAPSGRLPGVFAGGMTGFPRVHVSRCIQHTLTLQRLLCLSLQVGNPFMARQVQVNWMGLAEHWKSVLHAEGVYTEDIPVPHREEPLEGFERGEGRSTTSAVGEQQMTAVRNPFELFLDMSHWMMEGFVLVSSERYAEGAQCFAIVADTTHLYITQQHYDALRAPARQASREEQVFDTVEQANWSHGLKALQMLRTRAQVCHLVLLPYRLPSSPHAVLPRGGGQNPEYSDPLDTEPTTEEKDGGLSSQFGEELRQVLRQNPTGLVHSDAFLYAVSRCGIFTGRVRYWLELTVDVMELMRGERSSLPNLEEWW